MPKKQDVVTAFTVYLYEKSKKTCDSSEVGRHRHYFNNLCEKDKKKYQVKADEINGKQRGKCDSHGTPVEEIQKELKEKEKKEKESKKLVFNAVKNLDKNNELLCESFFVICITHYLQENENSWLPAEVGVCRFSFKNGVEDTFIKILPVKVELGMRSTMKDHSEKYHKIPLDLPLQLKEESRSFKKELEHFLASQNVASNEVRLFTQNDFLASVESMIEDFRLDIRLKICSFDVLVQQIYSNLVGEMSETEATIELKKSDFEFNSDLACLWHQNKWSDGSRYCALSLAQRWIFNMFKCFDLEQFQIAPKKGKHIPIPYIVPCEEFQVMSLNKQSKKHRKVSSTCEKKTQGIESPSEACNAMEFPSTSYSPKPPCESFNILSSEEFPGLSGRKFTKKK